jgi:hypothetical protein
MALAHLLLCFLHSRRVFLGGASAYDSCGFQAVSMTVGALFGLLMGLTFGGAICGKCLDQALGPEAHDESPTGPGRRPRRTSQGGKERP